MPVTAHQNSYLVESTLTVVLSQVAYEPTVTILSFLIS